jgi:hypothetical protein
MIRTSDITRWCLSIVCLVWMWTGSEFALLLVVTLLAIDAELLTMLRRLEKEIERLKSS